MTLGIAIWGAVLATLTFCWNLWKWKEESPRISASVEALESFCVENGFRGIRMILRNRGGKKTTIEQFFLHNRQGWFEYGFVGALLRLRNEMSWEHNVGISNPKTVKLPVVLDVNEMWEGFIPLELDDPDNEDETRQMEINREIPKTLRVGRLRYSIQCSHTNRRICGFVRNENW